MGYGPKPRARKGLQGQNSNCGMSMASGDTAVNDGETSSVRQANAPAYNSESGFESLDPVYEEALDESINGDEVLMNVSPNVHKKPKDQLFINFFGMYTNEFVKE